MPGTESGRRRWREYDLVVIGGGSAGLVIGEYGARLGARVAIVEARKLGGDCTWHGCVPSKALLATARVAWLMRHADTFGLPAASPQVDLAGIMEKIRAEQEAIYLANDRPERFRALGCDVIFGLARFLSPHEIEVAGERIRSRRFSIATGSRPALPPVEGLDRVPYLTNETLFDLTTLPERLLVVGGGAIGVELGQAMARLGATVTILEMEAHLLPQEEPELGACLEEGLSEEGVQVLTGARLVAVEERAGSRQAVIQLGPQRRQLPFDALLVATGRQPNIETLNLVAAGVELDPAGQIRVDENLRTTTPHIFACGDVLGRYPFTHTAAYEAVLVLRNALFPLPGRVDYRLLPRAVFTDPPVASLGLTESEARARYGQKLQIYRYPFTRVDRAIVERRPRGFVKLICRGLKQEIVGAHIIGPAADEMIHEYLVAMRAGLGLPRIAELMHVYPTFSQAARYAAQGPLDDWLDHPVARDLLGGYLSLVRSLERLWQATSAASRGKLGSIRKE